MDKELSKVLYSLFSLNFRAHLWSSGIWTLKVGARQNIAMNQ